MDIQDEEGHFSVFYPKPPFPIFPEFLRYSLKYNSGFYTGLLKRGIGVCRSLRISLEKKL